MMHVADSSASCDSGLDLAVILLGFAKEFLGLAVILCSFAFLHEGL
jgi:hypothetical protein